MQSVLLDTAGHRRSPATMPGYHRGRPPRNKGEQYPADPPTVEEIVAVMRTIGGPRRRPATAGTGRAALARRPQDQRSARAAGERLGSRSRRGAGSARSARAVDRASLDDDGWPPLRFHDLRHTFASYLIVDLGLDVAQVSRILGHARITITLDIYTHLFEDARHARDIRARMAASPFANLLNPTTHPSNGKVIPLR
jgi:integrase